LPLLLVPGATAETDCINRQHPQVAWQHNFSPCHLDHDLAVSLLYIWLHARMLQTHDHANEAHYAYLHVLNPEDAHVAVERRGAGPLERQQACGLIQRQHLPSELLQQWAYLRVAHIW
jgi:hypothetical protein